MLCMSEFRDIMENRCKFVCLCGSTYAKPAPYPTCQTFISMNIIINESWQPQREQVRQTCTLTCHLSLARKMVRAAFPRGAGTAPQWAFK